MTQSPDFFAAPPASPPTTVAVMGLPAVADALRDELGFEVISKPDFRSTVLALSQYTKSHAPVHLLVETLRDPGLKPWLQVNAPKMLGVSVVVTDPDMDLHGLNDAIERLHGPVTLGDLVSRLGFELDPGSELADRVVLEAPAQAEPAVPEPATRLSPLLRPKTAPAEVHAPEADDDLFDEPAPVPAPRPAPVIDNTDDEDDFADLLDDGPVAPPVVRRPIKRPTPTPEPVTDGLPIARPAPTARVDRTPDWAENTTSEEDDMFTRGREVAPQRTARRSHVAVSYAPKGGVGKTTDALMLAQVAGDAGYRTLLVDANRGQGNGVRTSLRLPEGAPNITRGAAWLRGEGPSPVIGQDDLNAARPRSSQDVAFDVILAPLRAKTASKEAPGTLYARVVDAVRDQYDLIVIDTQEVEGEKTDMFLDFVIPEMRSGAWPVGIVDYDFTTSENMLWAYREFADANVPTSKQLLIASNWPDFNDSDKERLRSRYGSYAQFVGLIGHDQNVANAKTRGDILTSSPAVRPAVNEVLFRITGDTQFAPEEPKRSRGLRGLFGGRR